MSNAKDLQPEKRFYGLFIGRSGSGKTCAELSWPGKTFVFDLDKRIKGGLGLPILKERFDSGDIEYEQYDFTRDGFEKMNSKLYEIVESAKGIPKYKNVLFNSASSLRRALLTESEKYTLKNYKMGSVRMLDKPNYGFESKVT